MGQTILSAGMVIIVTIAVINANRLVMTSETTKMEAIARMEAADIAMEIISEARLRRFDENATDPTRYQSYSEFTPATSLGRETGETFTMPDSTPYKSLQRFDDFDDFNGYSRIVDRSDIKGFVVTCNVFYARTSSLDVAYTSQRYVKTIQVHVSHPQYLVNAVTISNTRVY